MHRAKPVSAAALALGISFATFKRVHYRWLLPREATNKRLYVFLARFLWRAALVGAYQNRYKSVVEGSLKMDQRAGGHRWPFDGSKCIVCGMTQSRFADTKKPCPGPQSERERLTVPDDDDE